MFSQEGAGFCVVINLKFQKVVTSLLASFALSKNKQKLKSSQANNSLIKYELNHMYVWGILLKVSRTSFLQDTFSVAASWNYIIVSTLSYRGTPRLWNTFEFASVTLETKSVVKINYDAPIHSAKKLKKHKVQNWVNTDIFLNNILHSQ